MSDRSAYETKMAAAKAENSTFEMDDDQALTPLKYAKFVKEFEAWYKEKSSKPQSKYFIPISIFSLLTILR